MIIALIYFLTGSVLFALNSILALIPTIPYWSSVQAAITWAFGTILIFRGIFPVNTMLQCGLLIAFIWIMKYTVKIILFGFGFLPWFHTPKNTPNLK